MWKQRDRALNELRLNSRTLPRLLTLKLWGALLDIGIKPLFRIEAREKLRLKLSFQGERKLEGHFRTGLGRALDESDGPVW